MRTGYSNFLGEYVDAGVVGHGDCEDFQIVCPCCREPIFKTHRPAAGSDVHFLSHYAKAESTFQDCENRVSGLSPKHVRRTNAVSRGQSIEWFMSVVPDEIWRAPVPSAPDLRPAFMAQTFLSVDMCGVYRKAMRKNQISMAAMHAQMWNGKSDDLSERRSPFAELSPLRREVRSRTAMDVEKTLYAGGGAEDAFRKVYCSALNWTLLRCAARAARRQASLMDVVLRDILAAAIGMSPLRSEAYLRTALRRTAPDRSGRPMLVVEALGRAVDDEIHRALCEIDYVDLMRRRADAATLSDLSPETEERDAVFVA